MSAFGYFGSKLRIAGKLANKLPPHNAWVELFCGSAAMTLAKKAAPIEIINDVNDEIVNFFEQLRDNKDEIREQIWLTPYSRSEFTLARQRESGLTKVERARRFFVAAMMAINGSFGKDQGGFSFSNSYSRRGMEARVSRWHGMPDYLESVIERLRRVRIEKRDALKLFKQFEKRPATLVYFDPPYLAARARGYDHDQNNPEFHQKILKAMIEAKCMILVSGYQNDLYEDLLTSKRGWSKQGFAASTKGNNGKSFKRSEVVWFNRAYAEALQSGRVALRFSTKETKNKKANPQR